MFLDESSVLKHEQLTLAPDDADETAEAGGATGGVEEGSIEEIPPLSKDMQLYDYQQCLDGVVNQLETIQEAGESDDLPRLLLDWCLLENARLQVPHQPGWRDACRDGTAALESSLGVDTIQGLSDAPETFCSKLKDYIQKTEGAGESEVFEFSNEMMSHSPYLAPVATPAIALAIYKEPKPCCRQHPFKGCHDEGISRCVCAKDDRCCNEGWDMDCAKRVERLDFDGNKISRCGRCPNNPKPVSAEDM